MAHYIDKAALVAEIDDWRDKIKKGIFTIPLEGRERADATFEYEILGIVRDFLDTLEVKEVDANDAFIKKACDAYCKACNKPSYSVPIPFCRRRCESYNNFIKNINL